MNRFFSFFVAVLIAMIMSTAGFAADDMVQLMCVEKNYELLTGFTNNEGVCWRMEMICATQREIEVGLATLYQYSAYEVHLDAGFISSANPPLYDDALDCGHSIDSNKSRTISAECTFLDGSKFVVKAHVVNSRLCEE